MLRVRPVGATVFALAARCQPSCRQQAGQSGEVVGGHRQDEAGPHPLDAAIDSLGHAADGFGPAEGLFDPLAVLDREGMAFVSG